MIKLIVTQVQHYSESMFRIRTNRPATFRFSAGEFVMLALDPEGVQRAYSITSGPGDDYLEFLSIKVPDGPLTGKLAHIIPGEEIYISQKSTGTLTLANLELSGNLWLLATGTGVAPFISIVNDPDTYSSFEQIYLVWSVRTVDDLNSYSSMLEALPINFIPIVTQDTEWWGLKKRITTQICEGILLAPATPSTDKIMICGSLEFNQEIKSMLLESGWSEGNKRTAGTFVQERAFVER
jgi:ferredoxin--NADP+ reductase